MQKIIYFGGLCLLLILTSFSVQAGFFDKMIMPGKLIEGHAEYENKCESCHLDFEKSKQVTLCINCHDHKNISDDQKNKKGFHGNANVRDLDCKSCHTEHVGRNADIIQLDISTFDHRKTDFKLKGKHQNVTCASCHKKDKKFHEAKSDCISCHKNDDRHNGELGKKCQDCHSEKSWKESEYDHTKETDFPLVGKHKDVACDLCHVNTDYKKTPKTCIGCHKINDVHNGRLDSKCETCHKPKKWKKIFHKHDPKKFKLKGNHKKFDCQSCHLKMNFKRKLKNTCISCHKNDDSHKRRYGKKCDSCHKQKTWKKTIFNHSKTKFELFGKHKKVKCDTCHRGVIAEENLGLKCISCHKPDDVHEREEGKKCDTCHSEDGWNKKILFDHDQSKFPLIGQHSIIGCESCHQDFKFKTPNIKCDSCHTADDTHDGRLGEDCALCHNPNDWRLWEFDHNTQTKFKLEGKHENLLCEVCHRSNGKKSMKLSSSCRSCHRADDVHGGSFGDKCDRCHNTKSFQDNIKIRR